MLVTALEQGPASGVPDNPGAWLMHAGKNRAIKAQLPQRRDDTAALEAELASVWAEQKRLAKAVALTASRAS